MSLTKLKASGYRIERAPVNENPFWENEEYNPGSMEEIQQAIQALQSKDRQHDTEIAALGNDYTEIESQLTSEGQRITANETNITTEKTRNDTQDNDIQTVKNGLNSVNNAISSHNQRITALEQTDSQYNQRITQTEQDVQTALTTANNAIAKSDFTLVKGTSTAMAKLQKDADTYVVLSTPLNGTYKEPLLQYKTAQGTENINIASRERVVAAEGRITIEETKTATLIEKVNALEGLNTQLEEI